MPRSLCCTQMEALPEVLQVAISEALTSETKLSWSVWDNREITSVNLLQKPDVSSPVWSEILPWPAAASTLQSVQIQFGMSGIRPTCIS